MHAVEGRSLVPKKVGTPESGSPLQGDVRDVDTDDFFHEAELFFHGRRNSRLGLFSYQEIWWTGCAALGHLVLVGTCMLFDACRCRQGHGGILSCATIVTRLGQVLWTCGGDDEVTAPTAHGALHFAFSCWSSRRKKNVLAVDSLCGPRQWQNACWN